VALALAPKCALCVLGYAGLGMTFGITTPELCGEPAGRGSSLWLISLALALLAWSALRLVRTRPKAGQ
jgi:hypothetical protein